VLRFTGFWTQANYDKHLLELQTLMAEQGQTPVGDPVYARYDAPFVPWFWRRNEIWLPVR
jgi:hypothetical protein